MPPLPRRTSEGPGSVTSITALSDYLTLLRDHGIDATFQLDAKGTLTARRADAEAPPVPLLDPALELGPTIGVGGMGIVREAHEPALGRRVAFKTVHPERDTPATRDDVFREAWVSGNVEHPNVVPVYGLRSDEVGRPAFTMRYVQGTTWQAVLDAPHDHPELLLATSAMEHALDVLDTVCRALHSAHLRGVLHRDLKPDNVLLGPHGEVYLMDWGLAVALAPGDGPLRLARDIDVIEGTPGYMAPEMAAGDGARIGVASDVFQLGALLHRILTGAPRFAGDAAIQVLIDTYACAPFDYGDDVDPDLADVAAIACDIDPAERYPSAEAFRQALAQVRARRVARALKAEAHQALEAPPDGSHPVARAQSLTAARRALEEALAHAPGDRAAQASLAEVEALLEGLVSRHDALAAEAREADLTGVRTSRRQILRPLSLLLVAGPVAIATWSALGHGVPSWVVGLFLTTALLLPGLQWRIEAPGANRAMRTEMLAVMGSHGVAIGVFWVSVAAGQPLAESLAVHTMAMVGVFTGLAYGQVGLVASAVAIGAGTSAAMLVWPTQALWTWSASAAAGVILAIRASRSPAA